MMRRETSRLNLYSRKRPSGLRLPGVLMPWPGSSRIFIELPEFVQQLSILPLLADRDAVNPKLVTAHVFYMCFIYHSESFCLRMHQFEILIRADFLFLYPKTSRGLSSARQSKMLRSASIFFLCVAYLFRSFLYCVVGMSGFRRPSSYALLRSSASRSASRAVSLGSYSAVFSLFYSKNDRMSL